MSKNDIYDLTCYCTVCDRSFQYGDENSPVFIQPVWEQLIEHYNLAEHQRKASELFLKLRFPKLSNRDAHTFICVDCAERALGRPLNLGDVDDCPFNQPFRTQYQIREVHARTEKIDKIWNDIHGEYVSIFYWTDGSRTAYNYDMATDSIMSDLGFSVSVEKPTEELTKDYILDLIEELEVKIIKHYRKHYHRDLWKD